MNATAKVTQNMDESPDVGDTVTIPSIWLQRLLPLSGYEALHRWSKSHGYELVLGLDRPLSPKLLSQLEAHKDRVGLIERALELGL